MALLSTVWLNVTTYFGWRGRQQHSTLMMSDLTLEKTLDGREYVSFSKERVCKTRQGKEGEPIKKAPKMFATPGTQNKHLQLY